MKRYLKTLVFSLAALLMAPQAMAYELPKPTLLAVYFWADWCPNCKVLSPALDEARKIGELDNKPILFVKLDLSNSTTIHQSVMLAQALGIAPYVQKQGSSTGYVAILDATSKAELARFDRTQNAQAIAHAFDAQLKTPTP